MKHHPRYCECAADHCGACLLHDDGYQRGLIEGRQLERAAIVAWQGSRDGSIYFHDKVCWQQFRECIERADHLRPDIKDGEGET